jgi:ATP-grasp ribosomal peptide maturase
MVHTVLILTDDADQAASRVAAELALRGVAVVRLDAAEFPAAVAMAAAIGPGGGWAGPLTRHGKHLVELAQVGAVYYRRPTQFQLDPQMSDPERAFAYGEARRGFGGVLAALGVAGGCLWVNDPVAAAQAEYKPVQLAAAQAEGLAIPRTLVTSDPHAAHAWATGLGRPVVYKALGSFWHADEGRVRALYTSQVEDLGTLLDPALSLTAHLLQEEITPKLCEARAVVVGTAVHAARINAGSERARVDWRSDYDALTYTLIDLPDEVARGLVRLHRRLGLVYGAADLVCDTRGRWFFLETNQRGEWGWLAQEAGLPVAAAVADVLEAGPAWAP